MRKPVSILLVEDAPMQRASYAAALEREGFEVSSAGSAEEGLRLARERPPFLVLSDYVMPDMNGLEFCEKVRSHPSLHDVIFLIFTAIKPSEEEKRRFHDQPDGWIDKNDGAAKIVATVREWTVMLLGPEGLPG